MLVLSNEEIEKLITMEECIASLEEMYRDLAEGKALNSPRIDNLAPCSYQGAYYGFKHMGGTWPRRGIQALRINSDIITHPVREGAARRVKVPLAGGCWVGLVELFSTETGQLLAIFPDGVAQRMRVGATNGLAAKYLARADASRVGLIGSGWQAGAQLMAVLAVRPVTEVKVYSKNRGNREAFAREASERHGLPVRAVETAGECCRDVDIIMSSTSSMSPIIRPEWIREGMHVSCIKTQEVDSDILSRCRRVVVNTKHQAKQMDNALPGTPNIVREHTEGWWNRPGTRWEEFCDLPDLAAGRAPGRTSPSEITCFVNNIGLGLQFAAVGAVILDKAGKQGIGRHLPDHWFTESVHP